METPDALNVERLIERSTPRAGVHWMGLLAIGAGGVAVAAIFTGNDKQGLQTLLGIALIVLMGGMIGMGMMMSAAQRRERRRLQAIDELLQLRRWNEAAWMLQEMLERPMRSIGGRVQALVFLISVLGQRKRYADAIAVQDYLLERLHADEGTLFGLKLGRVMAMLHDERLFDADRAINDLRRMAPAENSGGLALVEIFRDVKTGHPQEAVEMLQRKGVQIREQLGHRAADAYALAARAYDLMENEQEARTWYAKATLLAPAKELDRYAEVAALRGRYPATPAPDGAP